MSIQRCMENDINHSRGPKMRKYRKFTIFIIALISLIIGFIGGVYVGKLKGIPFVKRKSEWSIGIYIGKDPFNFVSLDKINNPVLTAKDITDISANFVADPFMINEGSTWYMFFEAMNADTKQGDIGLAISDDGLSWSYRQIVLDEPFHLSYPYVFKWRNEYYMIPESCRAYSIRLYKAVNFPTQWSFLKTLLSENDYVDSSIFYFNDKWWLFTSRPVKNDILRLYFADDLMGAWTEHPRSPIIIRNANIARPGGRVLIFDDRIIRYTQDDDPTYGNQVHAFEIIELTTVTYKEKLVRKNPILKPRGVGWNKKGMHHIDPHQIEKNKWIACVDGFNSYIKFGFEY